MNLIFIYSMNFLRKNLVNKISIKFMNKAVLKKKEKQIKTRCPFCLAPLIVEFGVKKCANPNCTFREEHKVKQETIL